MKIKNMISTLQRFEKDFPNMDVGICLDVSEEGVLANNNFVFHNVEDRHLVLISPESLRKAEQLYEIQKRMREQKGEKQ